MSDPDPVFPSLLDEGSDKESNPREKPMSFFGHLEELRWTLVKSAGIYLVFAILIGIYMKEFNDILMWPFRHVSAANPDLKIDLGTTTIMEGFTVVIQMCFLGALAPAAPFILYFIGRFISPALSAKELKLVTPTCIAAIVLFLLGCSFSFFLLVPSTLRVSIEINQMLGYVMRWTPGSYYSLLTWLVLGVGSAFEFPLLIVLLVYMGILKVATLTKYRRHAIVVIFIIAAVVTPTPDPVTQTIFAVPLYVLFEIAVFIGWRIEKRRALR
ncbi:MAG: twin-arginine translocase subunit TatC [Opitutaceae bacterium]